MNNKGYRPTATELYENYRTHYANRKKAQALGASVHVLKPLADLEHAAWTEYVLELRRTAPDKRTFRVPSRPL